MTHNALECIPKKDTPCTVTLADGTEVEDVRHMFMLDCWHPASGSWEESPENPVIEWSYQNEDTK